MQYPLQRDAGVYGDLMRLEVMTQLPRGHKEAEEQFCTPEYLDLASCKRELTK